MTGKEALIRLVNLLGYKALVNSTLIEPIINDLNRLEELDKSAGREVPVKPIEVWEHADPKTRCTCSACVIPGHNYCWNCGKKLDWSNEIKENQVKEQEEN